MGTSASWIAVRELGRSDILSVVGLVEASPDQRHVKANLWSLPNGWTFLLTFDFGFPTPERMAALSAEGRAVALSADDRVMFSVVRGYERGKAVFAIEHDGGQHGCRHMAVAGTPPAEWPDILARLSREQDKEDRGANEVDYLFDAPLELGKALCGYRYDEEWPKGQEPQATGLIEKRGAGLIGRLFGRR